MLDLHIQHTIANGIKFYKDNRDNFDEVMSDISGLLRDKYFDKLTNMSINFNRAYSETHNKFPLITCKIEERTNDRDQVLGNRGHQGQHVLILNQECELNIYANDYDMIRILHRLLQSSLLIFKGSFLQIGYLNLEFVKSSEVEPDEDIAGENVMVFHRKMTYLAQKQILATPPAGEVRELDWVLNSPNII